MQSVSKQGDSQQTATMTTTNNVEAIRAFHPFTAKTQKTRQALFFVGRLCPVACVRSSTPLLFHSPALLHAQRLPLVPAAAPM
jgi:hypothetical protein